MKESKTNKPSGKKGASWAAQQEEVDEVDVARAMRDDSPTKKLALVTWEDITAYSRVEIPSDFEEYRLIKKTLGLLWLETADYVVLVQDYDVSNQGKGYHHNDFHIIPRGVIKEMRYLGEEPV